MKKLVLSISLFAGLSILFAGCSKDDTKDATPTPPGPKTRTLTFNVSYELQGQTDGLSFAWNSGDAAKLGIIGSAGPVVNSTKIDIVDKSAAFTGEIAVGETSVYCFYPTANNASLTFAPFMIEANRTQANAGDGLEGTQLPLISGAVAVPAEGESVSVAAKSVPTILRLAVYSSDAALQSEIVKSVSLQAAEKINGTYTWNFSLQSGSVTEGTAVSTVALTNYYELAGVGAVTDAKPIYMMVAPVPVAAGYKYLISTNKASYIYTVNTAGEFGMGKVLDVAIDLKNAMRTEKGIITFDASAVDGYECEAAASAQATEIGVFKALVSGVESADYTKEFYKNLTFTVKDAVGAPATWVTPSLGTDGKIKLMWEMNPKGEVRTAVVTANFTLTDDTYWYDGNPAFTFNVKQKPTVVTYDITNVKGYTSWFATSEGFTEKDLGWIFAVVNGAADSATAGYKWSFYNFRFEARDAVTGADITWAKAYFKNEDNHPYLLCEPNTGVARTAKINIYSLYAENEKVFLEITISQHESGSKSVITYKPTVTASYTAPKEGITDWDAGYYLAYVDGNINKEIEWTKYYDLKYTIENDKGEAVTWLSAKRNRGDSNHPLVTVEANSGGLRRAYIKARWDGDQYAQADKNPIFTITVMQGPATGDYVTYTWSTPVVTLAARAWAKVSLGTYDAFISGSKDSERKTNNNTITDRYNVVLKYDAGADWLSELKSAYDYADFTKNNIWAKVAENKTGADRSVVVTAQFEDPAKLYSTFDPVFTFTILQTAQ